MNETQRARVVRIHISHQQLTYSFSGEKKRREHKRRVPTRRSSTSLKQEEHELPGTPYNFFSLYISLFLRALKYFPSLRSLSHFFARSQISSLALKFLRSLSKNFARSQISSLTLKSLRSLSNFFARSQISSQKVFARSQKNSPSKFN